MRYESASDGVAAVTINGQRRYAIRIALDPAAMAARGLTATEINPRAFSYGYDRLRFVRPVFIGDTIRTRVTAARKEDDPKRAGSGRLFETVEVLNQKNEVVLACEHIYIIEKKEGAS